MGTNYNPKIVTNGLTTYYDPANSKSYPGSGTTVYDLSSANQNGTMVNGSTYSSDDAGTFVFDGVNDYVGTNTSTYSRLYSAWTVNGVYGYPTEKTIEIWVRTSETSGYLVSRPWNGGGQYNYRLHPGGAYVLVGGESTHQESSITFSSISDGEWHQVVLFMDKTNFGVSIDGASTFTQKAHNFTSGSLAHGGYGNTGDSNLSTVIMSLYPYGGAWGGNTGFSITGSTAIFRQYNRVLSQDEIKQNFNATRGRFGI